jgi:hypothetical protein
MHRRRRDKGSADRALTATSPDWPPKGQPNRISLEVRQLVAECPCVDGWRGAQPMTVDLAITEGDDSGKAQTGIVEVTDGTLRMCLDTPGAGQRPSEFGVIVFEARKNEP